MTDLGDDAEEQEPPAPTGWFVDSEQRAAFAVDRILSRRADLARTKAACANAIDRAEKELARTEGFFLSHLTMWFLDHPPRKGSSLHFTGGSFASRRQPERIAIVDEAALAAWAADHAPQLLTYYPTPPPRVPLKAIGGFARDALPPGVAIIPESITYDVKAPKEKP